jgi:hypothetical protein
VSVGASLLGLIHKSTFDIGQRVKILCRHSRFDILHKTARLK